MPNGFLNISHKFVGESQFIVVEWVKSTAQGTPVVGHVTGAPGLGAQNDTDQTQVFYPSPHVNEQLQVINLPEDWMLVRFWRSSDGIAKDVLLLELAGNARTGAVYPITRYEYVVDRGYNNTTPVVTEGVWSDPVTNDIGIRDTRLLDKTYWVQERGTGDLLAAEVLDRSDDGGGFDFVESGKIMNSGAVYIVYVLERIETAGDDSAAVGSNDDVYIMTSDQDYDPLTMGGRTIIVDIAATVGTLTMPNLALVADSRFKIQTHTGTQRNLVLQLDAGDTVDFRKQAVNKIIMGEAEELEFLVKDNVLYCLSQAPNHDKLGLRVWADMILLNTLPCDGGSRVLADYPRVEQLLDALPVGATVNDTVWNTSQLEPDGQTSYPNKGKWMREGLNFRPPDMRDKSNKAVTATDGSIVSGGYQHQQLASHYHFMASGQDGGSPYLSASHSTGGNLGYQFNGSNTVPDLYRTGNSNIGGTANRVNATLLFPLICI